MKWRDDLIRFLYLFVKSRKKKIISSIEINSLRWSPDFQWKRLSRCKEKTTMLFHFMYLICRKIKGDHFSFNFRGDFEPLLLSWNIAGCDVKQK